MTLTPRSLFNIIIKVFGLFFLKEIINSFLQLLSFSFRFFSVSDLDTSIGIIAATLLVLCFYCFITYQLLFRTSKIIDVLKLDKGFSEDEFSFEKKQEHKISLTTADILTISLILIGGYILVDTIPDFCRQIYSFVDREKSLYRVATPAAGNMLESAAKIVLGLLIIGERKRIVAFIEGRKEEKMIDNTMEQ